MKEKKKMKIPFITQDTNIFDEYSLRDIRIKKILFKLISISNYLMQDHENDDLTDTQKLWKALQETIEFLMEYISEFYGVKWNELKYTDEEIKLMKKRKIYSEIRTTD